MRITDKKLTVLIFIGVFSLFAAVYPGSVHAEDCIRHGDVNFDGLHTSADAQLAFQMVLGHFVPTWEEACAADCNGDETVSAADAQVIFLVALGVGECVDPIQEPTATPFPTVTPTPGPSPTPTPTEAFITLVEKSTGLNVPKKEKGKTEYEVVDMNGDGYLDIVSVGDHGSPLFNSDEHGIMVWFGDGQGNWSVVQTGDFGYGGCAVGDLNNDGLVDIAWGIHHNYGSGGFGDKLISAALGDGSGAAWTPWDSGLAENGEDWGMFATDLADFNNDGYLDIISQSFGGGNGVRVYRNHGDGTWSQAWASSDGNVNYTLETGDFNADGNMDFICTLSIGSQQAAVYFGDGDFGFTRSTAGLPQQMFAAVDVGDFDNDGADDIVISTSSGVKVFSYRKDSGEWVEYSNGLPAASSYWMVQFGHVNGDDFLDVVVYAEPTGQIFRGDGAGNWTADSTFTFASPATFSALRIDGDFDHDGREDIIAQAAKEGFPVVTNILRAFSPWREPVVPAVRLVTPNGGETFTTGGVRFIKWLTAIPPGNGQARIDLHLSISGPAGPWTSVAADLPDNGKYQWIVPDISSTMCRIKVVMSLDGQVYETISSKNFAIVN